MICNFNLIFDDKKLVAEATKSAVCLRANSSTESGEEKLARSRYRGPHFVYSLGGVTNLLYADLPPALAVLYTCMYQGNMMGDSQSLDRSA